ncbi:hypothetical protein Mgra_00009016 [Meloidogyne graminicola]|uniref:Uncharacterized protein n=1 Tax=Meloidogyne graminicola TaxID=189291 RepID=A0A8S9ZE46_9BILA|nr:hypothetical protein Mgra_00009016 [Meloidogyne graminicola]
MVPRERNPPTAFVVVVGVVGSSKITSHIPYYYPSLQPQQTLLVAAFSYSPTPFFPSFLFTPGTAFVRLRC